MPNWELDSFERWAVPTIAAAVGHERIYNSFRAVPRSDHDTAGFVVMRLVPGIRQNTRVQGPEPIIVRPNYDITVVTKGSPTDASEEMVRQMVPALQPVPPATSGDFLISGAWQYPLSYESAGLVAEEFFTYRGGNFQFWMTRKP